MTKNKWQITSSCQKSWIFALYLLESILKVNSDRDSVRLYSENEFSQVYAECTGFMTKSNFFPSTLSKPRKCGSFR